MAKFKLVKRPETIAHTVRWKDFDNKDVTLKVDFNYRSRSEFAALMDEGSNADLSEDAKLQEIIMAADSRGAEFLVKALNSWDLEEELNEENAALLFDQHQAAANAIITSYRNLCLEGRLGN